MKLIVSTMLALAAIGLSTQVSAAGWAACNTPNPPFFCEGQGNDPVLVEGPKGEQGEQGPRGKAGKDGIDGLNGKDGRNFNSTRYQYMLASSTALGGLQFRELKEGQFGYAVGVGGQLKGDAALAVGVNFGLTNNLSANVSVSRSFKGGQTSVFVGVSGKF